METELQTTRDTLSSESQKLIQVTTEYRIEQ